MGNLLPIRGQIQPYQWGGYDYLCALLGHHGDGAPQAEYWLGNHICAPATIADAEQTPLNDILREQNTSLNFLLKVLDVRHMLSIQVHPNAEQAIEGFNRENAQNIPLTAANRNYKDANPKPELMVALSEFWLLHGLKQESDIRQALRARPFLIPLAEHLEHQGLAATFTTLLDSSHPLIAAAHQGLLEYIAELAPHSLTKANPDFWILRWLQQNPGIYSGLLTLYFLNLVCLKPGDTIYQPAGLLHAYLEGQNIELMANSDNVLRAGLTPKHIDVTELLKIANLRSSDPGEFIAKPTVQPNGNVLFETPFAEFTLAKLDAQRQQSFKLQNTDAQILFCLHGSGTLHENGTDSIFNSGSAFYIAPQSTVTLSFNDTSGEVFLASNSHKK